MIVHAMAISLAFLLTANIKPPPQKESFRWEVSLVSPPPSSETQARPMTKASSNPIKKPLRQPRPISHRQPVTSRIEKRQYQTRQSAQPTRSIVQTRRIQSVAPVQQRSQVQTASHVTRTSKALAHTPSPRIARQEMPKQVRQSVQPAVRTVSTTLQQSRNKSAPTKTRRTAISGPLAKSRPVAREAFVAPTQATRVARQQASRPTPVIKDHESAVPVIAQVQPAVVVRRDSSQVATPARQRAKPMKTREALIAHPDIDTPTVRSPSIEKKAAKEERAVNNATALPHHEHVRNVPVRRSMAVTRQEASTTKKSATKGLSPEVLAYLKLLRLEIERARIYPLRARRMGLQGTTKVRFALLPNGEIKSLKVAEPSGYPVLDAAALATVKKILPFHPPDTVELGGLSIEVPIRFWLR